MPPTFFGFWHVSSEAWYNEASTEHIVCYENEGNKCADSIKVPFKTSDHTKVFGEYTGCSIMPKVGQKLQETALDMLNPMVDRKLKGDGRNWTPLSKNLLEDFMEDKLVSLLDQ